jgi:hypothetical protein
VPRIDNRYRPFPRDYFSLIAAVQYFDDLRSEAPSPRLNVVGVGHQRSGLDRVNVPANGGKTIFSRQPNFIFLEATLAGQKPQPSGADMWG